MLGSGYYGLGDVSRTATRKLSWADRSNRKLVVTLGVATQCIAVLGSTAVLIYASAQQREDQQINVFGVVAFTAFGVLEKLGTQLSDVSVKREWTPQLFKDDDARRHVNTRMSQIDLSTEVVGPFIAGIFISSSGIAQRIVVLAAIETAAKHIQDA
eukprot:CAMPEP_0169147260 /NCGR_PEP_ID=MMETSP1015-20121227/48110_1 /TAXON_ID=342587 /ORGANISM="Karlodinium micrum, Strain CCMP2283" /LENGTH=155 /DNA_ID=CAMNT_0009215425 /DNA_START=129 /DNA_END=596 /DNA_ORIENTATION=+